MKKVLKRSLSVVLSLILVFSVLSVGAFASVKTDCAGNCSQVPTIIVPGLFQSEISYYENGEPALNSDGEEYKAPLLLNATADIVKNALKEVGIPLVKTFLTQKDPDKELSEAFGKVIGDEVLSKIRSDSNGDFINDIRVIKFDSSVAECTDEEKEYIYNKIPLDYFKGLVDEDHIYFFTYNSFGNMFKTVDELYALIQQVKEETGHDKVNIVPISQGGSIANGLLEFHPEVVNDLNRIIFVVPALDGSALLGEIFENGLIDDDEQLYSKIFPLLVSDNDGQMGYMINIALRLLPNSVINDILDAAVDSLISNNLKNCTLMWGLVSSSNYPGASEKYLSGDENKEIRRQTDLYYNAQLNRYDNILNAINSGVEVFDIVDYNVQLYPLVDSYDNVNADGIIQLESESMGATGYGVNVKLPDGYVSAVNNCTDPENHDHSDPNGLIDPLTGLLPEQTFYFCNQDHEKTAQNDVLIKLVASLASDKNFTSVYSYPDKFPQFNMCRNSRSLVNMIEEMSVYDTSALSDEDKAELAGALEEANTVMENTVVDVDAFESASKRLSAIRNKILYGKTDDGTNKKTFKERINFLITSLLKFISDFLYNIFGGNGFSELFKHSK